MGARKKKRARAKSSNLAATPNINAHGAVDVRLNHLSERRKIRGREIGDGQGMDVGIGTCFSLEKALKNLSPTTKQRLLAHVKNHVDTAMKPLIKLIEREGEEYDVYMFKNVGPNLFRTIIELLEEER